MHLTRLVWIVVHHLAELRSTVFPLVLMVHPGGQVMRPNLAVKSPVRRNQVGKKRYQHQATDGDHKSI
jgi:hypothetical protein